MLTHDTLKTLLHYDSGSGVFVWLARASNRIRVGDVAGTMTCYGYVQIRVGGTIYKAHRLAWLYMTGCWPNGEIDHKNGLRSDNRWDNLREATPTINRQNRRSARLGSRTGTLGVTPFYNRFVARIRAEGKQLHIGTFATAELAHAAYVEAKRRLHPGNTL